MNKPMATQFNQRTYNTRKGVSNMSTISINNIVRGVTWGSILVATITLCFV